MVHRKFSPVSAYTLALAVTAVAAFAVSILRPSYQGTILLPFMLPVMIGALFGGLGPGLLATCLGAMLATYLSMPSVAAIGIRPSAEWIPLGVFVLVGVATTLVVHLRLAGLARHGALVRQQLDLESFRRRQAEQRLAMERDRLAMTFASIGDAAVVTDPEGRIELFNPPAQSLTGWPEKEARGQPLENVFRIVNEQTRKPVENPVAKVLRTGAVVGLANHTVLIARDGREVPISDCAAPIRGTDGQLLGVILIFRDDTDSRRAAAALRESETLYRAIGESIPFGAWICEPNGDVRYLSDSFLQMTGMALDEHVQANWASRVHPDDLQPIVDHWSHCVKTGSFWDCEYRIRSAEGPYRWILSRGVPIRNAEDKVTAWAGMNLDITQMRQLQDELIRKTEELTAADRQKDEFLATLAHEMRNPLAPIMSAVQILYRTDGTGPQYAWARDVIDRQTRHLTRLVDDLLDVSRISRGKVTLNKQPLELAAIVNHAMETSRPLIQAHGHSISTSLPSEPVWIEGDLIRIAQVVSNLLNNAAKYSEPNRQVWLTAAKENGLAVIRVRDAGLGISPEVLPRIFDLFAQADRSLDRSKGGLGIGLSLVKKLVDLHGGSVEAKSEGIGKGSEFIVRLPLLSDGATEPSAVKPAAAGDDQVEQHAALRVLVVDDNADVVEGLSMLLELEGCEVERAAEGPAALAIAQKFAPDVVLLDIDLPVMDGCEVAQKLRVIPETRHSLLLAISGFGRDQDLSRCIAAGFDHHFVKPVRLEDIIRLIAEHRVVKPDSESSVKTSSCQ
ncbi:multi-sensor hybrid histidine kinase [Methylocaldum marinum]|uniref:histidine kinase n=1 Tax=Methylocaldum marinum TaxID=1432792 RepID=A0A250KSY6_9GAMM|nr:PAS domain S-box protein [Methylocaldum marinum]BBA34727.1 multi-sensor hybrid histidine kinase [Methylocaldum marinum]